MKAFRIKCGCDICSEEWSVIGFGKLPDFKKCPNCGHACDLRHAFNSPDGGSGDDSDDTDGLSMVGGV